MRPSEHRSPDPVPHFQRHAWEFGSETADQTRHRRRNRALAGVACLAVHAGLALILVQARREPPPPPAEDPPMIVALVDLPKEVPAPEAASPAPPTPPTPKKPQPKRKVVKTPPPEVPTVLAQNDPAPPQPTLTASQIAGAATTENTPTGRTCNMVHWLQAALRKDALVQSEVAAARAAGQPIMVWNGDWVRNQAQDGKGMAAVREAIMWEVAFAPEACRSETVRGLVLISLNDSGSARLAVGQGYWRWSQLLH